MDFAKVVARRRMVRRYRPDPVPRDALDRVLDATLSGPSAGYSQGIRLVVVTTALGRSDIAQLCGETEHVARGRAPWLSAAPVHVVLCVRPGDYRERYAEKDKAGSRSPQDWPVPWWWVDAGAALSLLLLAAVDEGLGAGVLQIPDRDALRELLAIPAEVEPVILCTVGYAAHNDQPVGSALRPRRPVGEQIRRERW